VTTINKQYSKLFLDKQSLNNPSHWFCTILLTAHIRPTSTKG